MYNEVMTNIKSSCSGIGEVLVIPDPTVTTKLLSLGMVKYLLYLRR